MNKNLREHGITFGKIILGGALIAVGVQFFLVPNQMVIGGISGLAIILHYVTGLPTGALIFLINAPIFLLTLRSLGLRFILTALVGIVTTSILVDAMAFLGFSATHDLILVTIFAGLTIGAGVGLIIAAGSSAGGTDMIARLVHKRRPGVSIGTGILVTDGLIIIAGALVFRDIDMALYAILSAYILKRIIDLILSRAVKQ